MKTFVSPDGTWEIKYPSDWSVDENNQAPNKWWLFHSNPDLAPAETELRDGEYSIEFRIEANTKNETVEDLLARYCEVPPDIEGQIEECRKATIIGRTWAWALLHETTFGGVNNYAVGTIAEGRVYESFAHVPDGEHSKAGLEQVREILATFKIEG